MSLSLSSLPALKLASRLAAIVMVSPVRGLRPCRSFLSFTTKLPNPRRSTRWFAWSASAMVPRTDSSTASTSGFCRPVFAATASTSCDFVIRFSVLVIPRVMFGVVRIGQWHPSRGSAPLLGRVASGPGPSTGPHGARSFEKLSACEGTPYGAGKNRRRSNHHARRGATRALIGSYGHSLHAKPPIISLEPVVQKRESDLQTVGQAIVLCRLPTLPEGGRPQTAMVARVGAGRLPLPLCATRQLRDLAAEHVAGGPGRAAPDPGHMLC